MKTNKEIYALLYAGAIDSLINLEVIEKDRIYCKQTTVLLKGCFNDEPMTMSNREANINIECENIECELMHGGSIVTRVLNLFIAT